MMNVMKSEWYRQKHNRGLAVTCMVFLGAMLLVLGVLAYFGSKPDFSYANTKYALSMVYFSMSSVFWFTIVFPAAMESTEKLKLSPVKNSVAFGITRTKLYLGKFSMQFLLCTVLYCILPAVYMGLSFLLLEHSNAGETELLLRALIGTYPLCVFMMAVSLCIIHNMGNNMQAAVWIVVIVFVLPKALLFLGIKFPAAQMLASWCPANLFDTYYDENSLPYFIWDTAQGMARCYIAGITGTILAVAAGLRWFNRREIK